MDDIKDFIVENWRWFLRCCVEGGNGSGHGVMKMQGGRAQLSRKSHSEVDVSEVDGSELNRMPLIILGQESGFE